MAKTKDFSAIIRAKLAKDSALADAVESERLNADIAVAIFEARTEAKLTQAELARRAGMHQPAIADEDADYGGHSISSLKRIAKELGKRLSVQFLPASSTISAHSASQAIIPVQWSDDWKPYIAEPEMRSPVAA